MAAGPLLRTVTVTAASGTFDGTLAVAAPASGAKIVGVFVKSAPPEFRLKGITLSDTAATAGSIRYDCAGPGGSTTYSVQLTVADSDLD